MIETKYGNYEICPKTPVHGVRENIVCGYGNILQKLLQQKGNGKRVIVFDTYPGCDVQKISEAIRKENAGRCFLTDSALLSYRELDQVFSNSLSDDRVFGFMTNKNISDCFDKKKMKDIQSQVEAVRGEPVFLVGPGSSLFCKADVLVLGDINRWEIQKRYRKGMPNWLADNPHDPILSKYKRGYFIEWRVADKHKDALFSQMDWIVDFNDRDNPKMISRDAFSKAMDEASRKPFRMEPYFDGGIWGGQWMKQVFGLPKEQKNYAWCFDGVPEENNINFLINGRSISFPMMDMVLTRPKQLLGEENIARFGREFPIRFDLLDTMEGGNLSLQVHPLTEYIQKQFGMHYTQDESYYILDATEDSCVYLGLKDNVDKDAMLRDLRKAQTDGVAFPVDKYINKFPVKKHDHVLIPAGTIHCSGKNTMVLEISATPYIFTFKLWDWGRIGSDGLPRPIHLDHGARNIQFDRNTEWVKANLIHQEKTLLNDKDLTIDLTGLHRLEFIETKRYSSASKFTIPMKDSMDVLNLVDGKEAHICSVDGSFEPFEVHYGETFIVPSSVKEYVVDPLGSPIKLIVATVRGND